MEFASSEKPSAYTATWPNTFGYQGKTISVSNLYPEAGDNINNNQIDTLTHADGLTVTLPDKLTTKFSLSSAADQNNCSVSYKQAINAMTPPEILTTTSGC